MKNIKTRYLLVIILLALTATIVNALQYDSEQDGMAGFAELQKIPINIGKWQGQDLHLAESVYEILETRAIIHRNYTDDKGNTILLSIVYYNDTKVDFHAPEACLGGRGGGTSKAIKILDLRLKNETLLLEVAEIMSTSINYHGLSYYYYKAGSFMGQNYIKMRLNLARNSLLSGDKSGALIRFSGNYYNDDGRNQLEKTIPSLMEKILPFIVN